MVGEKQDMIITLAKTTMTDYALMAGAWPDFKTARLPCTILT